MTPKETYYEITAALKQSSPSHRISIFTKKDPRKQKIQTIASVQMKPWNKQQ